MLGGAAGWLTPAVAGASARLLAGWCVAAAVHLAVSWATILTTSQEALERRTPSIEDGLLVTLALPLLGALASVAGIAAELKDADGGGPELPHGVEAALVGATLLLSWTLAHTTFALHYARDYYGGADGRTGGLDFPQEDGKAAEPGFSDFVYFSFTIGAALQTSDVAITSSSIRRVVTGHQVLAFLFNTVIVALAVNAGGS